MKDLSEQIGICEAIKNAWILSRKYWRLQDGRLQE